MENVILDQAKLDRTLKRIAHEILEAHSNVEDLVLIGIKTRGIFLANRLSQKIQEIDGNEVALDHLDISFYRDDLTYRLSLIHISEPTRRLRGSRMPSSA